MKNQLVLIMAGGDPLDILIAYMDYKLNGAWYYPIPEGELDRWASAGPETELGTTLRILNDETYSSHQVAKWLDALAEFYVLDLSICKKDVDEYRLNH